MQNVSDPIPKAPSTNEEFINNFFQRNLSLGGEYEDKGMLNFYFKTFAKIQASPNFEKNLNDFFLEDTSNKIKEALKDKEFLKDVFIEALECNNFRLIDKIITSIDNNKNLEILNDLLEKKILDMTDLGMPETPKELSAITMEAKSDKGENILHIIASQTYHRESLEALKNIIDKQKNTDFITHLLDSKNERGKTPLDIARENNNKDFSNIFVKNPYTTLSEIISSKKLIEKKVSKTSCAVM